MRDGDKGAEYMSCVGSRDVWGKLHCCIAYGCFTG